MGILEDHIIQVKLRIKISFVMMGEFFNYVEVFFALLWGGLDAVDGFLFGLFEDVCDLVAVSYHRGSFGEN